MKNWTLFAHTNHRQKQTMNNYCCEGFGRLHRNGERRCTVRLYAPNGDLGDRTDEFRKRFGKYCISGWVGWSLNV